MLFLLFLCSLDPSNIAPAMDFPSRVFWPEKDKLQSYLGPICLSICNSTPPYQFQIGLWLPPNYFSFQTENVFIHFQNYFHNMFNFYLLTKSDIEKMFILQQLQAKFMRTSNTFVFCSGIFIYHSNLCRLSNKLLLHYTPHWTMETGQCSE